MTMVEDLLSNLNENQQEAVKNIAGPSVILAGAGSGKTRVLVHKVLHLIINKSVSPDQIIMITFTNKAASEMKARIARIHKKGISKLGYIGTFHSFCCSILRRDGVHLGLDRNFSIYDTNDQEDVIKKILKKIDSKKYTPSYFLNRISDAKNSLVTPEKYLDVFSFYGSANVAEVYFQYQKELEKNRAVDFDDLIMKVVQLFTKHPPVLEKYQERYQYILVDEFQDTNYAQYVLTRQLGKKYHNITVVGDFSQSIYSWRGADIRNLEKFSSDFPETKIVNLEQNYRSSQKILDFAYEVISKNQTHPVLHLFTKNQQGEDITYYEAENEQEEAIYVINKIRNLNSEGIDFSNIAILYRTNAQSRVIEEAFLHYGIPYTLIGGIRFYDRKEIKDILSYLRLFMNPSDEVALDRIKKLGKRKWDQFKKYYDTEKKTFDEISALDLLDKTLQKTGYLELYNPDIPEDYARLENVKELRSVAVSFPKLSEFLEQVALVQSEYFQGEKNNDGESVRLMTLHQAKGLEFDYVFIVGLEEGILPHSRSIDDTNQLEEERRLFYVGITRARTELIITYARRRFIFGRRFESAKSRFLGESEKNENSEDIVYF